MRRQNAWVSSRVAYPSNKTLRSPRMVTFEGSDYREETRRNELHEILLIIKKNTHTRRNTPSLLPPYRMMNRRCFIDQKVCTSLYSPLNRFSWPKRSAIIVKCHTHTKKKSWTLQVSGCTLDTRCHRVFPAQNEQKCTSVFIFEFVTPFRVRTNKSLKLSSLCQARKTICLPTQYKWTHFNLRHLDSPFDFRQTTNTQSPSWRPRGRKSSVRATARASHTHLRQRRAVSTPARHGRGEKDVGTKRNEIEDNVYHRTCLPNPTPPPHPTTLTATGIGRLDPRVSKSDGVKKIFS